jgi:pimeloyl-ACP methyl ester carboxylesterase
MTDINDRAPMKSSRGTAIAGGAMLSRYGERSYLCMALLALCIGASASCGEARATTATSTATEEADLSNPVGKHQIAIVLVHGAWADGSSWAAVIGTLQRKGYSVFAPAVRQASLSSDIAATRKFITDLQTPVLAVGHSYGGAVITGAATDLPNVKGLVYVAAFVPDTGETVLGLVTQFSQQFGAEPVGQALRPDGPLTDPQTLIYLDRPTFGQVFVQDIDPARAAVLAATQRPPATAAFGEPFSGTPAWRQLRSWYQVSRNDRVIGAAGERFMANRIGAETIELESSHASPISHPEAIARLIERAARAVE